MFLQHALAPEAVAGALCSMILAGGLWLLAWRGPIVPGTGWWAAERR